MVGGENNSEFGSMRTAVSAAADRASAEDEAASSHEPPSPGQMLTRLGVLLVIAFGFGLIARHLVGGGL